MSAITVTNVAPSAEESNLREFFSTAGEIERVRIFDGSAKTGGRRAVIEFTHKEAVSAAVLLNGCLLLNHPLNIVECAYPVSDDVANEDVKLNTFESKFAGFLGKTLLAGKQALEAVKDFDERNQITAKTKQNIKALDDKLQFTANVKKFDEKAGVTEGVKKTVATVNAQAKEIDRSLKISATTNAVVGMGKDAAGMAVNKAMQNKVISDAAATVSDFSTSASIKMKTVAAEAKATANIGGPTDIQSTETSTTTQTPAVTETPAATEEPVSASI
ncbi:Nucleotide-binding, alpha-beta plait [Ostreococcus tauri]|uniref:Nucleotide-binding, alpha-beta plait n=1 Tax=Ostreococcus tauri TaxID=70448 RepID=A0A090LXX5_OSTTA|nr:Nucleotide-binding, alpha-beta plait [Ostreococcus tauri]CEF96661.1 Nucleotide-binding, alpha-beta plait [Ostreococcus tauri]|eukprot:XP_022838223.1 Nucleotide-binding, alpha-beta plait [Ostreococcus tauri]